MMSKEHKEYVKQLKKEKSIIFAFQMLIIVTFIALWEILSRYNIINSFIFSSPSAVIRSLVELYKTNNLFEHILTTIYEILISFTLGIGLGFIIAIVLYSFKKINKVVEPFLTLLNSLPKVALGPIIILWFGATTKSIVFMALLINLILNILTILNGFHETDILKIRLLKSYNASKLEILKYLVIPSAYNTIISSLKINISMSLIGVIMGEFLSCKKGVGYLIMYGTQVFNLNLVYTGIFLLIIISLVLYKLVIYLEKKLLRNS